MKSVKIVESGEMLRICISSSRPQSNDTVRKRNPTKGRIDAMERLNHKRRVSKLLDYTRCNFGIGDWHVILTLAGREETTNDYAGAYEQLRGRLRVFVQHLRRLRRKHGHDCPAYIYVLEGLNNGTCNHIHALFHDEEGMREDITNSWSFGHVKFVRIDTLAQRDEIAKYIVDAPSKMMNKHRFGASSNCKKPMSHPAYTLEDGESVVIPEGYAVVEQSCLHANKENTHQQIICRRVDAKASREG